MARSIENLDDSGFRANAWWDNMIGNNSVKENFRLSQLFTFFSRHFVSGSQGNKQLVNHSYISCIYFLMTDLLLGALRLEMRPKSTYLLLLS